MANSTDYYQRQSDTACRETLDETLRNKLQDEFEPLSVQDVFLREEILTEEECKELNSKEQRRDRVDFILAVFERCHQKNALFCDVLKNFTEYIYPYFAKGKIPNSGQEKTTEELHEQARKEYEKKISNYSLKTNSEIVPDQNPKFTRNIVIIGKVGAGKSVTTNTILGRDVRSNSETLSSAYATGEYMGHTIKVVDTPGIHGIQQSNDAIMKELKRVSFLMRDGVHCYIICIDARDVRMTKQDEQRLKIYEELQLRRYCMIVYTNVEEPLKNRVLQEYIQTKKTNTLMSKFLTPIGDKIVAVNNATNIPAEIKRNREVIIAMVDKVVRLNRRSNRPLIAPRDQLAESANKMYQSIRLLASEIHPVLIDSVVEALVEHPYKRYFSTTAVVEYAFKLVEENSQVVEAGKEGYLQLRNDLESCEISPALCKLILFGIQTAANPPVYLKCPLMLGLGIIVGRCITISPQILQKLLQKT